MRIYKIGNRNIDLDHVLAVDELFLHWEPTAWGFNIQMMLLDKLVTVYLWPANNAPIEAPDYQPEAERIYQDFLKAWQNKPESIAQQSTDHGGFVSSGATILYDDHYLYLADSDGKPFKRQLSCTIDDVVNKPTIAIIKVYVAGFEKIV